MTVTFGLDEKRKVPVFFGDRLTAYALAAIAQQAQEPVSLFDIAADRVEVAKVLRRVSRAIDVSTDDRTILCHAASMIELDGQAQQPTPPAPQPAPVDGRDAEIAELRAEVLAWRNQCDRLTHQVICCGVAASHPDATMTTRGAYAGKWNSGQAEEVRKLRAERDALASLQSPAPQTKGQP